MAAKESTLTEAEEKVVETLVHKGYDVWSDLEEAVGYKRLGSAFKDCLGDESVSIAGIELTDARRRLLVKTAVKRLGF